MEYRKVRVLDKDLLKGVKCPFCGVDNTKSSCQHLDNIYKPVYRSVITNSLVGEYVYTFKK